MAENGPLGRILFLGLTTIADFRGNVEWRPKRIKIQLLPYDDCNPDSLAINLDKSGFVRFYSDGMRMYLNIVNFAKHQNPHKNEREAGSEIPEFSDDMRKLVDLNTLAISRDLSGSNREQDGTAPAVSLIPYPYSLIPVSLNPQPDSQNIPDGTAVAVVTAKRDKPTVDPVEQQSCRDTWSAYAEAYRNRYGADPIRNAAINSKVKQLVKRLGHTESPAVAAFYLTSNDQFVVKRMHEFGLLLNQAESFRTQWATGNTMTGTKAMQLDRTASNFDAVQEAIRMSTQRGNP